MQTPDKICVAPHQIFDYDLDIQEVGHNGAEEYVRKDALLEWLEHAKTIYNIRGANAFELLTLQMFIEHINEM